MEVSAHIGQLQPQDSRGWGRTDRTKKRREAASRGRSEDTEENQEIWVSQQPRGKCFQEENETGPWRR